jgi:Heterokaryon incompatibility protein (HET)
LKTGKDNLESLLEGDSLATHWNEIPKTIRDTVNLVDQLGIQYLWVDCLCIVQDDTESKHDQIQAMSGIYANAYVTIIAGNGWDANHGLGGIQGVTEPRHLSTFLKSDFRENLQPYSSIWYSRGWVIDQNSICSLNPQNRKKLLTVNSSRLSRR